MKKFHTRLIYLFSILTLIGFGTSIKLASCGAQEIKKQPTVTIIEPEVNPNLEKFTEARNELAVQVDSYIKSVAPNSEIDPFIIIDLCAQYDVDLMFVMAQGQLESHYATKGTAARTNSVFNVGAYDGHSASRQQRNGFGFDDPNQSIEPYLVLLTNDYLVNGKTTTDLMSNYVNKYNMRYASNRKYEAQMRSIYRRISSNASLTIAYENFLASESDLELV